MLWRKLLLLGLLSVALPVVAFANTVDFANSGGTLSGSSSGLSLAGSTLIFVNGLGGKGLITGNDLGNLTFSTCALSSGTLTGGATFMPGGSFTIMGNGSDGLPKGVIFTGTFASSSPVTWAMVTLANGTHNYTLSGALTGTMASGWPTSGATIQLTINTGKGFFNGSTQLSSGDTNILVPEPSTLTLFGTGLIGLGAVRRILRRV